jgi:hypothetical protein
LVQELRRVGLRKGVSVGDSDLAQSEGGWGLGRRFGFWVHKKVIWLWVKVRGALEGFLGGGGGDLAEGEGRWDSGRSFGWVKR